MPYFAFSRSLRRSFCFLISIAGTVLSIGITITGTVLVIGVMRSGANQQNRPHDRPAGQSFQYGYFPLRHIYVSPKQYAQLQNIRERVTYGRSYCIIYTSLNLKPCASGLGVDFITFAEDNSIVFDMHAAVSTHLSHILSQIRFLTITGTVLVIGVMRSGVNQRNRPHDRLLTYLCQRSDRPERAVNPYILPFQLAPLV